MSDITLTAAKIAVCFPDEAEIYSAVAAVALTAGLLSYCTSAGKGDIADGNGSGTTAPWGLVLGNVGAGQGFSLLKRGHVYGFDLSGLAYFDPVYMSDTAGALGTTAGSTSVICGRVVPLSDSNLTKVLYFELPWR